LAEKRILLYVPGYNFQAMGFFKPITAPYLTLIIKPRNFAKRRCKLQWLTPPTSGEVQRNYVIRGNYGLVIGWKYPITWLEM